MRLMWTSLIIELEDGKVNVFFAPNTDYGLKQNQHTEALGNIEFGVDEIQICCAKITFSL